MVSPFPLFHSHTWATVYCYRASMLILNRHFNGEESFDTGPMAPQSEPSAIAKTMNVNSGSECGGTKL